MNAKKALDLASMAQKARNYLMIDSDGVQLSHGHAFGYTGDEVGPIPVSREQTSHVYQIQASLEFSMAKEYITSSSGPRRDPC